MIQRVFERGFTWVWMVLILQACQPDNTGNSENLSFQPPTAEQIQAGITSNTSAILLPDSLLAEILPTLFAPYTEKTSENTSFSGQKLGFSQARAVYHTQDGFYLAAALADYAADPKAFLHLFQQHQQIREAVPPAVKGRQLSAPYPDTFVWAWEDEQTGVHYLEAGLYYRFHLRLSTNQSQAIVALEEALVRVDLSRLRRLSKLAE